jgi:NAD(P)-dependent dehydrogenase (short-subunit alcohol dehydrogenase family)
MPSIQYLETAYIASENILAEKTLSLKNQRIMALGGTSWVGLAVAQLALGEGACVVVGSNREDAVERASRDLAQQSPSRSVAHMVDVTTDEGIKKFFDRTGPFDHLVYTAGEDLPLGRLVDTDLACAHERFEIRYWGAVRAVKYGLRLIRDGGSIVLTSGFSATRPRAGWTSQASIQSAVEGLTRALAVELAPIRVNAVLPSVGQTPRWNAMSDANRRAFYEREEQRLPVGRVGNAVEIAAAYVYFMKNTYATGNVLSVDGGGARLMRLYPGLAPKKGAYPGRPARHRWV